MFVYLYAFNQQKVKSAETVQLYETLATLCIRNAYTRVCAHVCMQI